MHILPLTDFSCANFLHIYPYVCIYIHTHTYVYIYFLSGYLYACLGRSVQGQIEHTHLSAHRVSSPLSTEQQMVYLSTNKIVLKDQAVHFRPRLIDFSIMAILVLNLLSALGLCFTPFSHQPPLSSNK